MEIKLEDGRIITIDCDLTGVTSKSECVSRFLKEEIPEHLEGSNQGIHWTSKEQAVAAAYNYCGEHGFSDSAIVHEQTVGSMAKPVRLNNVLKVPVTLAAEMIQKYHISELPWLKKYLGKDIQYVKVFKPYEELCAALDDLAERGITQIPYVEPHSNATFLKEQIPADADWITDSIPEDQCRGYIKEFYKDDVQRKIKGFAYLTISKMDPQDVENIENGKVVDVSIGFICDFTAGGIFKDEAYLLTQRKMRIGHLAGLHHDHGKCPKDICGLNQDRLIASAQFMVDKKEVIPDNHIVAFHSIFIPIETPKVPDPPILSVSQVPIYPSLPIPIQEVTFDMTIEEQLAQLKVQLADKDKELASLQTSALNKQITDKDQIINDMKVRLDAANALRDAAVAEAKECGEKMKAKDADIEKLKKTEKEGLVKKLKPIYKDALIQGKKVEDLCLHDLQTLDDANQVKADGQLAENGIPKPDQQGHTDRMTGGSPENKSSVGSSTITAEDYKKLADKGAK